MTSIQKYYGITGPVPFENVTVDTDNLMFLDPHVIRLRGEPDHFAAEAVRCLDSFFDTVARAVMSTDPAARTHAESDLQRFTEPWETRLGMAETGFSGHGAASDIGTRIWEAMNTDLEALLHLGILKNIEELPLFVEGVDRDITSDITTRIVFGPLAAFTKQMLDHYPEFSTQPHQTAEFDRQVWDPDQHTWAIERVTLPVTDGKALLLVPRGWTRRNLLMSPTRFFETSLLSYVQGEQAVALSNGKILKTPKDRLKQQPTLQRGRKTHLQVALRAHAAGSNLLELFRTFVADRFDPPAELDAA
ncbi:hypothetical protein AB0333_15960 [Citricoccus sp. NPDC079358]|uniref:hypothetical protein n=1 Tax=Citricoccus sp. NPDC079358 TaxID=3154653 RepID=UPI00344E1C73